MIKKLAVFIIALGLVFPYSSQAGLAEDLSGRILLQVEQNGESWYVNPDNDHRYFMGRPADAFQLMRELGLGVAHTELQGYLSKGVPSRLSGKILLDVEANGEAYYINPVDMKAHFLGRPADAFAIMRALGLGITTSNLSTIPVMTDYTTHSMPQFFDIQAPSHWVSRSDNDAEDFIEIINVDYSNVGSILLEDDSQEIIVGAFKFTGINPISAAEAELSLKLEYKNDAVDDLPDRLNGIYLSKGFVAGENRIGSDEKVYFYFVQVDSNTFYIFVMAEDFYTVQNKNSFHRFMDSLENHYTPHAPLKPLPAEIEPESLTVFSEPGLVSLQRPADWTQGSQNLIVGESFFDKNTTFVEFFHDWTFDIMLDVQVITTPSGTMLADRAEIMRKNYLNFDKHISTLSDKPVQYNGYAGWEYSAYQDSDALPSSTTKHDYTTIFKVDDTRFIAVSAAIESNSKTQANTELYKELLSSILLYPQPSAPTVVEPTLNAADIVQANDHVKGPANARVTFIEYCDLEGPFCLRHENTIDQILAKYPNDVRFVYRHFPLSFHPEAWKAAEATECAAEQGKFWEMKDLIFEDNAAKTMSVDRWKVRAIELGLNSSQFNTCLDTGKYYSKVQSDFGLSQQHLATGTPSNHINGQKISGAVPFADFDAIIQAIIN